MCPMVPIFTCGLLRSNFSFAMSTNLLPRHFSLNPSYDLFRDALRHLFILAEMHREAAAALRSGTQFRGVTEHLTERHHRLNQVGSAANLGDRKSTRLNS